VLVAAIVVAAVIGVSALAKTTTTQAPAFVQACTQRSGPPASVGDLNVKLKTACANGQKPLKLALYPVAANAEYAVANVFVSRGGARRKIWASYSATMGSPIGTTTGGQFRFTCSAAQAPCKVSIAAAVLSHKTGRALVLARVLIYKENEPGAPEKFCEYADASTNSGTPARIDRVPLDTRLISIRDRLNMGIGGTLDCGAGQAYRPVVKEIDVPAGSNGSTAAYDVWANFGFK
jgi:hypothetical protein